MTWGAGSRAKAATLHPDNRKVAERVDRRWSNTVLDGERSEEEQQRNVDRGVSKTLRSTHLLRYSSEPEKGVDGMDLAPDPLRWPQIKKRLARVDELLEAVAKDGINRDDRRALRDQVKKELKEYAKELGRWYAFAGYVHGVADELYERGEISAPLRHGYDWDGDHRLDDQTFDDLPHHERRPTP